MFSPFRDEHGQPKELADVTFADLAQLADYDEGYVLEFKRAYTGTVRNKISQDYRLVCQFARRLAHIGVADDDHSVCPVPRGNADYSQIIGELCRRHVSPAPPFDVRFIADPANDAQGVVVIRVEEGELPPYVADGVVEVREGSTSGAGDGCGVG